MTDQMKRIAVIGNHLPRLCGIATFTADLVESLAQARPDCDVFAVAMNDREQGYAYPSRVQFEVAESEVSSYRRAADFLNIKDVDIVCFSTSTVSSAVPREDTFFLSQRVAHAHHYDLPHGLGGTGSRSTEGS